MNFSQLSADGNFKISFKLDIVGTSAIPSVVRVGLSKDNIELFAIASKNGDSYEVDLPLNHQSLISNECQVKIEVIINGKLIVPYKEMINLSSENIQINANINTLPKKSPVVEIDNTITAVREQDINKNLKIEKPENIKKTGFFDTKKIHDPAIKKSKLNLIDLAEENEVMVEKQHVNIKPIISEIKIKKTPFNLIKSKVSFGE